MSETRDKTPDASEPKAESSADRSGEVTTANRPSAEALTHEPIPNPRSANDDIAQPAAERAVTPTTASGQEQTPQAEALTHAPPPVPAAARRDAAPAVESESSATLPGEDAATPVGNDEANGESTAPTDPNAHGAEDMTSTTEVSDPADRSAVDNEPVRFPPVYREKEVANPARTPPEGMSEKLVEMRSDLTDPRAIAQLDRMYASIRGNNVQLERICEKFTIEDPSSQLQNRLVHDWEKKNPEPDPPRGEALDQASHEKARAVDLYRDMVAYREQNPQLAGISERIKALGSQIDNFSQALDGRKEATQTFITGEANNVNGIAEEFSALQRVDNPVRMNARFSLDGKKEAVEVDVVGNGGRLWVDTKAKNIFDTTSTTWTGDGDERGIREQIERMVRSAQQNHFEGAPPTVLFDFTKGVTPTVKTAAEALGTEVRGDVVDPQSL